MIGNLTAVSILVVTALMFWPHNHRRRIREKGVSHVRASIAPWLTPDPAASEQPTGGAPPTLASGCSRTAGSGGRAVSGPAVPTRVHLELAGLPVHHLGRAS
jgi:hypothetical protein